MNKMKRYICCVLCAVCLSLIIGGLQPVYAAGDGLYGDIDSYLKACAEDARIPAMSVTVVDKDRTLFSRSYGQCESADTPFMLGSVSKSFTAVCVMQLAEQGKINLTDNISVYLPDATDGDRITVAQLLNHTSGLGEHQTLDNYEIINEQGVHNYANVNYSLAGKIIEAVSGKTYRDYITENLVQPLGLSHTAASYEESLYNGVIDGYINYWGFNVKTEHRYPSDESAWITVPAGYISSSAADLGRYLQMYLNGGEGIISRESIDAMFSGDTVYVADDVPFWYGYGWATVREPLPEPVLRHSGLVETGTTCIFILPERGIAVAIETNVNDFFVTDEMMDRLGWGVVLMLLGQSPNEITGSEYVLNHILLDFIMLVIFAAAAAPICLLPKYARSKGSKWRIARLVLMHFALPVGILLIVPVLFATPLWVAKAFVPDVFITVVASSALLLVAGLIKGAILLRRAKRGK